MNPVSDLYARHADWVVRDGREPRQHRNQLYLDPLRAEVRDFEVGVVDRTLGPVPGISYVKWDANRPVTDPGSSTLAPDRQANVWVDQVWATWEVMARVAAGHPEVELMLCASGGGRTDHGTLRWFHEFWTSDNTDPVTRVRMQWACSHFFPASAMAAHVTRWGGRPLEFACAVALSGRFGFDLDLDALTEDEVAVCRRAVAVARRTQDLVQQVAPVRLVSPVEGDDRSRAALAHVGPDRSRAVVFAHQLEEPSGPAPRLLVPGLDPERTYAVRWTDLAADEPVDGGRAHRCCAGLRRPGLAPGRSVHLADLGAAGPLSPAPRRSCVTFRATGRRAEPWTAGSGVVGCGAVGSGAVGSGAVGCSVPFRRPP